jgi:urea transport system permease protein
MKNLLVWLCGGTRLDRRYLSVLGLIGLITIGLPVLSLSPMASSPLGLDGFQVNLVGQVMAFALLAMAHDLVWGYAGYLSLGHGIFFAVGGYLIGMHMIKVTYVGVSGVPTFLDYMGLSEFPVYWSGFEYFGFALLATMVLSFLVAFVIGFLAFRSRVVGVYFAILSQAFVYIAMLVMSRNDTGFGGNNGIADFKTLLGLPLGSIEFRAAIATISALILMIALIGLRRLTAGPLGKLLIGIRDDEDRLRVLGYETLWIKTGVWCLSAMLAALAGLLYVPQIQVASPQLLSPMLSIEIAVWVAIGGRGYLYGAIIGAILVNVVKFWLTRFMPELWPFILTGSILLVVVVLRNGLMDPGPIVAKARALLPGRKQRGEA